MHGTEENERGVMMTDKTSAGILDMTYSELVQKARDNRKQITTALMIAGTVLGFMLMYARAFLGTELTDEAYYVAEVKEILNGNIPYAYNYSSKSVGFTFLLIPPMALYKMLVPDLAGIFLFTRLCFVTYKLLVWSVVYRVLRKSLNTPGALLVSALMLPLNGPILNFSYNTVPELTLFMVGCLLYDVIEQDASHKRGKLIFSGFMTGVACFANPGWSIALIIFLVLIAVRISGRKEKTAALLCYGCAVLAEVLLVVIGVSLQTGFSRFWYGFGRLFINPIPTDSINPDVNWLNVLLSFAGVTMQCVCILALVSLLLFFMKKRLADKVFFRDYSKEQTVLLAVTTAFCLNSFYVIISHLNNISFSDGGDIRGYVTVFYLFAFMIVGLFKKEKIVWYLGIYQITYSLASLMLVSADVGIWRFINTYSVLVPVIYALIRQKTKPVRVMACLLASVTVISLGYANFKRIYRDAGFNSLKYQVSSGVYKGLYTVSSRYKSLPELEEYLNSVIDDDESYAFRDNAPYAYLMTHKGKVCESGTWDILQYTAGRNAPSALFDYYRVRDMIPDKIIYIDSGRDDCVSLFAPDFKYNDWVNEYYDVVDDVELNGLFRRVIVFKYNGKFDGDYQWWIDKYWKQAD